MQTVQTVPTQPQHLHLQLKCLSQQYLPFILPVKVIYTIILPTDSVIIGELKKTWKQSPLSSDETVPVTANGDNTTNENNEEGNSNVVENDQKRQQQL